MVGLFLWAGWLWPNTSHFLSSLHLHYIFKRSPSTASRHHLIQNIFTSSLFDFPSLNAQYLEVQMTVTRSIWGPWSGISQYCDSGRGSKSSDAYAYNFCLIQRKNVKTIQWRSAILKINVYSSYPKYEWLSNVHEFIYPVVIYNNQ